MLTFGYHFLLLAFVFIVGPTVFIMETTVTGFGNMIKRFLPYGDMDGTIWWHKRS